MVIQVRVIGPAKREILVDVCDNQEQMKKVTVLELRKKIIDRLGISQDSDLRLVFTTETLEDCRLLVSCGIQHMSTVHTLLRQPGGQQQLRVILPTSSEKVLDLCDNQEQMKKMTVMQVKKKITEQLIGKFTF
uniref:Ubiquitin-like domain-containing protein n=1 Tax=Sphaeramia orbicularis TaxID=375764 RepID=A0A672Z9X8_9TELE